MTSIVPEDRPKTGEIFKEKRNKTRHKLDAPILSEQLSDYPGSLNARDAVPPMVLMMDDVPEDVQKSTLSDPVSLPTPELAVKKVSKDQSLVDLTRKVKKTSTSFPMEIRCIITTTITTHSLMQSN